MLQKDTQTSPGTCRLPLQADALVITHRSSTTTNSLCKCNRFSLAPATLPALQPTASLSVNRAFGPLSNNRKSVNAHASTSDFVIQHRAHNPSYIESQCRRVSAHLRQSIATIMRLISPAVSCSAVVSKRSWPSHFFSFIAHFDSVVFAGFSKSSCLLWYCLS